MKRASSWFGGLAGTEKQFFAIGGVAVVVSFMLRAATLAQPLVEAHAFRQTQTAYTAVIYHRQGIDLFQTPLPILGPPWVVPLEFPLFQAIAALVMDVGVPAEIALRGTSLFFFLISMILLWEIVRLEMGTRTAAVAVVAYGLAPLGLLWSRTSMIETIAVAGALGAVLEAIRWDRSGGRVHLAAAIVIGTLAALIKITTAGIWLAPALFLLHRSRTASIALVAIPAAGGLAWTAYTDAIKAATPATVFLTSSNLSEWNFGTVAQRLDPSTWLTCAGWLAGLGFVVLLAPFAIRRARIGVWALATLILGPLVFTNLYLIHDYYWMAVAPAAAILTSVVVRWAVETMPSAWRRSGVLGLVAVFVLSYLLYPRWMLMLRTVDEVDVLGRAAQIKAATAPGDLVAIDQGSWSPAILYYADRRGYMEDPHVPAAPSGYVRFKCPTPGSPGDCVAE